jgi:hypothetical protein
MDNKRDWQIISNDTSCCMQHNRVEFHACSNSSSSSSIREKIKQHRSVYLFELMVLRDKHGGDALEMKIKDGGTAHGCSSQFQSLKTKREEEEGGDEEVEGDRTELMLI